MRLFRKKHAGFLLSLPPRIQRIAGRVAIAGVAVVGLSTVFAPRTAGMNGVWTGEPVSFVPSTSEADPDQPTLSDVDAARSKDGGRPNAEEGSGRRANEATPPAAASPPLVIEKVKTNGLTVNIQLVPVSITPTPSPSPTPTPTPAPTCTPYSIGWITPEPKSPVTPTPKPTQKPTPTPEPMPQREQTLNIGGIPVVLEPGVDEEIAASYLDEIRNAHKNLFTGTVKKITISPRDLSEIFTELQGLNAYVLGATSLESREVWITGKRYVKGTAIHELLHTWDVFANHTISSTTEFMQIYRAEKEIVGVTPGNMQSAVEFLASAGEAYFREPEILERNAPLVYAFFKEHFPM